MSATGSVLDYLRAQIGAQLDEMRQRELAPKGLPSARKGCRL